jgi:hypothetical protein
MRQTTKTGRVKWLLEQIAKEEGPSVRREG